ncbi:MAG TPA: 3'-5' exonuclease, partial [Acidobacteriaceae bacterium]|nr:3'-5' exonuclease [Acidobacteriaceae bacterium]
SEHAGPLYAEAARRALGRIGSAGGELQSALRHLLQLRDNNLGECESLIAEMLAQRDQWVLAFPLSGEMSAEDWERARSSLEKPFRDEVKRVHERAYRLVAAQPALAEELVELARYACDNGNGKIAALAGLPSLPRPDVVAVEHWRCLAHFLLTDGEWRRQVDKRHGFPKEGKEQKQRMGFLLEKFAATEDLREALCAARDLPEPKYKDEQWETLRHIFVVLRQAVAELMVLFAERDTVDFTQLSLAAREVLRGAESGADVLLALSGNLRHLLVDEFQDTSLSQHDLLRLLVHAWELADGRTCFLVGDPMQSIYGFRQAEVELFEHVAKHGIVCEGHALKPESLELTTNFRSHEGLTTRWNEMFAPVFAEGAGYGRIRYSHTFAYDPALPGESVHVEPRIVGDAPGEKEQALEAEAERVLKIIEAQRARIEQAKEKGGEYRVAVLARTRSHLARTVSLLRERGIGFRAVELEKLTDRQELIDLMSLVRALLHPMDRVAWLSVLRAPWCGLTLQDLHTLAGADDAALRHAPVLELIESRLPLLSADGAARLKRVAGILRQALATRYEGIHAGSFSQWIERTWRSLGGPRCLDATAYENAQVFFAMLDEVAPDGMECLTEDFETEMERLFAQPDPNVSERAGVQLMTIHKAKGLGFDVVIVPGLGRKSQPDHQPLICSMERTNPATGEREMLLAPIGSKGDDAHATYEWVRKQISARAQEELKRVLYVACTRARRSLHLLGTAERTQTGLKVDSRTLLGVGWPGLHEHFEAALKERERVEAKSNVIAFPARSAEPAGIDLAAAADPKSIRLRRLPADVNLRPQIENVAFAGANVGITEPAFERPHGSRDARHKGSVVHGLLEQVSRGVPLDSLEAAARTMLRGLAYSGKALEDGISEVLAAVRNCLDDPDGAWVLAAHAGAQSEVSLTGWKDGALETLRPDRVFVAGAAPREAGEDHLWIIDYKMSAPAGAEDFLAREREQYAPQLAGYARALREARGTNLPVRFGLYYPRIGRLDWWSEDET